MNQIFAIMADGKRVGITVAPTVTEAQKQAVGALTRSTSSKEDSTPDYQAVSVIPSDVEPGQQRSGFVTRLLSSIAEVSNSRFISETA